MNRIAHNVHNAIDLLRSRHERRRQTNGVATHTGLSVYEYGDGRFRLSISTNSDCRQTVGFGNENYVKPRLSSRPQDAPIIHLNGPKTFGVYGPASFLPRHLEGHSKRHAWLRLYLGSPGLGAGTFAGYHCKAIRCASGFRKIEANVEFASRVHGADPIKIQRWLDVKG